MQQVIGLTGVAGSGKSTVANYLVEQHGFTRLSFAAPLKKMLRTLDPYITSNNGFVTNRLSSVLEQHDNDEIAVKESHYGKEYRRLLQVLGTDCIRAVDEDFWVKAAMAQMDDPDGKYVFDDVRFPNEAEVIKGFDPRGLWNIHRRDFHAVNGHASEQHEGQMGEFIWLWNYRNIAELHAQLDDALDLAFEEASV